jgi:hypothetical protein
MSLSKIADLEARSLRDAATHCWHWQGGKSSDGIPRLWAFDHERGDKRCMSGPKAVWNIAHNRAPRQGWLVYRTCFARDCVNPAHHAQAPDKAAIGRAVARAGARKGKFAAQAPANALKASAAAGITYTPAEVVRAIRAAGPGPTSIALAQQFGLANQTVSRIRRGESHREVA